jgi:hypothetical protein
MIVDCDCCAVRGGACRDCVITLLLGAPPGGVDLDGTERFALHSLAEAGMVPRLQLVSCHESQRTGRTRSVPGVHQRDRAERSATDGERSRRHVG